MGLNFEFPSVVFNAVKSNILSIGLLDLRLIIQPRISASPLSLCFCQPQQQSPFYITAKTARHEPMTLLRTNSSLRAVINSFSYTCFAAVSPNLFLFQKYSTMSSTSNFAEPDRSYSHALSLLDTLASNRTVQSMVSTPGVDMNAAAIPEMLEWVGKAGYSTEAFNKLKVIHVAGTKGKGSVCAMVSSILLQYGGSSAGLGFVEGALFNEAAGKTAKGLGKIGLYTSPHLISPRERIRINHSPISQDVFAKYFFDLWDRFSTFAASANHVNPMSPDTKPGYFRYLTIMAFHVFLQEGVESAIIECGIGGEYDSTNVLPKEAVTVSAITRLGIDHVGMLGTTIEEIAWHKAGIFKEGVPSFSVSQPTAAVPILERRAIEKNSQLKFTQRRPELESGEVKIALEGDFQKNNATLAIEVVSSHLKSLGICDELGDKLPAKFIKGLNMVKWEGRCEVRSEKNIEWYIDGAHTLDSIEVAAQWYLSKLRPSSESSTMLIFNQQTRDAPALMKALHSILSAGGRGNPIFKQAIFCANTAYQNDEPSVKNLAIQEATAEAWSLMDSGVDCLILPTIEEAINHARANSNDGRSLQVLVTGSLHLVGGFLKVLERADASK
jgi:folylpolyglutamate synthase